MVFITEVSSLPSPTNAQRFLDSYEDGLESENDAVKVAEQYSHDNEDISNDEDIANAEDNRLAMMQARSTSNTPPTSVECCGNSEYGLLIYRFEATLMNREDALKNCQRNGGELAAPLNMKEFIVLENFVRPFGRAYIGYNDFKEEGKFVDNNGQPTVINNFYPHEPNNVRNEDCLEIFPNGQFNDIRCSSKRPSICEFRVHGY
ncbi:pulmonary surfactant-associated protein D-like [Sycon ciliatum]|uniref:pulmonary surfactant-associated protein D-like n=1 Tax=Sycon ciliatum TaxID=27933 RepID=UPI0031F62164